MSEFQLSSHRSLGRLPWQLSNRTAENVCVYLSVSLCACVCLYAQLLVCLQGAKACRGNLLISWPISIYMKTNYSSGWGNCLVSPRKEREKEKTPPKAIHKNRSQQKGRIEQMNAKLQPWIIRQPVYFDKINKYLLDKLQPLTQTPSCWEGSQSEHATQTCPSV